MARPSKIVSLKVRGAESEDVYKDIVRISEASRHGLKTGKVHKFSVPEGSAYFILRGSAQENDGKILMDEAARGKLNLGPGAEREFEIQEAGFWGELRWVWNATDPTYRIAGRLGVLSFSLAILALWPVAEELLRWIIPIVRKYL
ncbi:MAG TPA: hypothetical protein VIM56_07365 [Rhizomicrobium sp.]